MTSEQIEVIDVLRDFLRSRDLLQPYIDSLRLDSERYHTSIGRTSIKMYDFINTFSWGRCDHLISNADWGKIHNEWSDFLRSKDPKIVYKDHNLHWSGLLLALDRKLDLKDIPL